MANFSIKSENIRQANLITNESEHHIFKILINLGSLSAYRLSVLSYVFKEAQFDSFPNPSSHFTFPSLSNFQICLSICICNAARKQRSKMPEACFDSLLFYNKNVPSQSKFTTLFLFLPQFRRSILSE